MLEIKDEDRIIGKICRGELSIVDRDIKNLATANLTEAEEENFRKLAQEINETIDRNQNIRKEMKEKVVVAEQKHGEDLEIIDEQIELLTIQRDKFKYGSAGGMMLGVLACLAGGVIPGFIVGAFTNILWVVITAALLGTFTAMGIGAYRIYKSSLKAGKLDEQIKELRKQKLCLIEQCYENGVDLSKTEEDEVKSNIVKNIYKTREEEKQHVDILDL